MLRAAVDRRRDGNGQGDATVLWERLGAVGVDIQLLGCSLEAPTGGLLVRLG